MAASLRVALGALLAVPLALSALPAAQALPGDTNGPILVRTGSSSELRLPTGELVSTVTTAAGEATERGEFSPTGDRIAHTRTQCADDACTSEVTSIVIRHHEGEVLELGSFSSRISSLTWSPDGQQVAFLATPTFDDSTIYRLPVNGDAAAALVSDSNGFDVDGASEISWSPDGGSILFVGGQPEPEGWFHAVHAGQLYTVPATGGAPQRFNEHFPEDCPYVEGVMTTCSYAFQSPEWSPDGTTAVVEVVEHLSTGAESSDERYLGLISAGGAEPARVTDLREPEDVVTSWRGPSWSPDGTTLLFHDEDDTDFYAATVRSGQGGRTRLPAALTYLHDWQPCPDGLCADWGSDRIPTSLSVTASPAGSCTPTRCVAKSVTVRGSISPVLQVPVKLRLDARKGGQWVPVASTGVTTDGTGAFSTTFGKPGGSPCRVKARFAGNDAYAPSSVIKKFAC